MFDYQQEPDFDETPDGEIQWRAWHDELTRELIHVAGRISYSKARALTRTMTAKSIEAPALIWKTARSSPRKSQPDSPVMPPGPPSSRTTTAMS